MTESPGASRPASLPRQFLRPLLNISLTAGPSYGYDLTARLHELGLQMIDTPAIYRLLRAMEHELLVESWWESSESGPRRRVYQLTRSGAAAAREHAHDLVRIRDLLDHAVDIAAETTP